MHSDSPAWRAYTFISFFTSLTLMLFGIWLLPGEPWIKAYMLMGIFFLTGSCFTLAKTLRDAHEAESLSAKLDSARAEKLLKDYERAA